MFLIGISLYYTMDGPSGPCSLTGSRDWSNLAAIRERDVEAADRAPRRRFEVGRGTDDETPQLRSRFL